MYPSETVFDHCVLCVCVFDGWCWITICFIFIFPTGSLNSTMVTPHLRTSASRPSSTVWMLWSSLQRRSRSRLSNIVPHQSVRTMMTNLGCPPWKSSVWYILHLWKSVCSVHEHAVRYQSQTSKGLKSLLGFCFVRLWYRGFGHSSMARRRDRSPQEAGAASGEEGKKTVWKPSLSVCFAGNVPVLMGTGIYKMI